MARLCCPFTARISALNRITCLSFFHYASLRFAALTVVQRWIGEREPLSTHGGRGFKHRTCFFQKRRRRIMSLCQNLYFNTRWTDHGVIFGPNYSTVQYKSLLSYLRTKCIKVHCYASPCPSMGDRRNDHLPSNRPCSIRVVSVLSSSALTKTPLN